MTTVGTQAYPAVPYEDYVFVASAPSGSSPIPDASLATRRVRLGRTWFGSIAAPLFAAASFVGPAPTNSFRRLYPSGALTSSGVIGTVWAAEDLWAYSSSVITADEIAALDSILALPPATGSWLRLLDE